MSNFLYSPNEGVTQERMAEILAVSVSTIKRWAQHGEIPAYKAGRFWRFDVDRVLNHLRRKK